MNVTVEIHQDKRPTKPSRLPASDDWAFQFGTRPPCLLVGSTMINDESSSVEGGELSRSRENHGGEFDTMADSSSMTEIQAPITATSSDYVHSLSLLPSLSKSNGTSPNLESGFPVDSQPYSINQGLMSDDGVSTSKENVERRSTISGIDGRSSHFVATPARQEQPAPAPVSAPLNMAPPSTSQSFTPLPQNSESSSLSAVGRVGGSKERCSSEIVGPSSSSRGASYTSVGIPSNNSFERGVRRRTSSDPIREGTLSETSATDERSPPTSQTINSVAVHTTVINSLQPKVPQQPLPPPVAKAITSSNSHTTSHSTNVNLTRHLSSQSSPDRLDRDSDGEHDIVEQSPQSRYVRFQEKLGSGAYKDVYRAYDTIEGIEVAWNQVNLAGIPKSDKARIINEVRLLERLHHPNIISFHGSWVNREREQVVFVTEILSSGTLKSFVNKVKVVRWRIAKRWAIQILKGLEYLHSQEPPIIHRDLKCDNIFINGTTGDLRIGDLGLSTVISSKSKVLSVLGTPEFMAPELYDESYDEKVDIYAFGMCMLEIFTKEVPYKECHNPAQIYKKVTNGIPPSSLARVKSISAREFIQLCLGTLPDANGEFRRPSATELLQHPFLQKNPDDEMEVEVLPAVEEPIVEERSSITNSLDELDSTSISSLLPPVPCTSASAHLPRAGSGDGASFDNPTPPTRHQEGSMPGQTLRASTSSDPLPAQLLPRPVLQPPMKAISVPVETDAEDDDAQSDHLRDMPVDEGNMRKVTVMMGRDQVLEEDDVVPALATSAPAPSSVFVPPPPAVSPVPAQAQVSHDQNFVPGPNYNKQTQPQTQQRTTSGSDKRLQNEAVPLREHQISQPRESQSAQMHQQQQPGISDATRQQPQMMTGQQNPVLGQQQRHQTHLAHETSNGPNTRQQPHQSVQHGLSGRESGSGDGGQYSIPPAPLPPPAPVIPQTYPVSPFGGEPVEEEVMKLILTLPFEGKTSNVQFDFHLIEDDPVQVAREMVTELGIPESAVLEISETISGLARAARIKQQEDKKKVLQGAQPPHVAQQHISPNQPPPQQLNASSQTKSQQMPPSLPTASGNQPVQHQALQSQQHQVTLSGSPHEQQSQQFGMMRGSNADQGHPSQQQQQQQQHIHASLGQTQMQHGHQTPQPGMQHGHQAPKQGIQHGHQASQPGMGSTLQSPYPGQVQSLQSHQVGIGQSHANAQAVGQPHRNLQSGVGQTHQTQHGMGQNIQQAIGHTRQNTQPGIGHTHVPGQNSSLAGLPRQVQGHAVHDPSFQAHDLQRTSRSFEGGLDQKPAASSYTQDPAATHVPGKTGKVLQYQQQEMNGKSSHEFGDHSSSSSLPISSNQDFDIARAQALKERPTSAPPPKDFVEDDGESYDGHLSFDESDSVSSTGESQEELRRMEEEFQRSMQRAKKVYEARMENLSRSLNEFESQHIQNMKKHEKERADFEKKAKLSEVEHNKRLKDLEEQWNQKKAEMIRKKHEGRNAVKKAKEGHVFPPVEEEKDSYRSMSQASSCEFEGKEES